MYVKVETNFKQRQTGVAPFYEITTLDTFAITHDGNPVLGPTKRRCASLVKHLVAKGGSSRVSDLCADLWPQSSESAARGSFRVALHGLRQALPSHGPELVTVMRGVARLNAEATSVDVWEALSLIENLSLSDATVPECLDAVSRFAGTFLPDDQCEAWSQRQRDAFASTRASFLIKLLAKSNEVNNASNWVRLESAVRAALEDERHMNELVPAFISYLSSQGRRSEAHVIYSQFGEWVTDRNALALALKTRPSNSSPRNVIALVPTKSYATQATSNFESEQAALGDALDATLEGAGQSVCLRSANARQARHLAFEVLAEAQERGAATLTLTLAPRTSSKEAICEAVDDLLKTIPSNLIALIRPVAKPLIGILSTVTAAFPEILPMAGTDARVRCALTSMLAVIADHVPLTLYIEGVEHADDFGIAFLCQIVSCTKSSRVLTILSTSSSGDRNSTGSEALDAHADCYETIHLEHTALRDASIYTDAAVLACDPWVPHQADQRVKPFARKASASYPALELLSRRAG